VEAAVHLHRTVERIRELGMRPGVSINPATPLSALDEILPYVDLVLVMTVNPGFGGQRYIPTSTAKIARLRQELERRRLWGVELEVDGGISADNAAEVVEAGANVLVAGAAVFAAEGGVEYNLARLRGAVRS
jgi:ribulose-phosphate 3-epimerase